MGLTGRGGSPLSHLPVTLSAGFVTVTEVSEAGQVPELTI